MFLSNKYTKIYYLIIQNAQSKNRIKSKDTYYESHHIIPKSIGGNDDKENKVLLTFKEHYVCHRLLPKMVLETDHKNKMNYALYILTKASNGQMRILTRHQRIKCLEANREASRNRLHKPNLGNKHSEETKRILKEKSTGRKHSEETIALLKLNNIRTNKSRGEKTKLALTGKKKSEEHKRKISESLKKKKLLVAEVGIEPTTSSV